MAVAEELLKLGAGVLVRQFASPYRVPLMRRIEGLACIALGGIAGFAGLGCGIAALWLWLTPRVGRPGAALLCAVTLWIMALLLVVIAGLLNRRPKVKLAEVLNSKVLNNKELFGVVERHVPELLIAAAVGGLVLGLRGRRPRSK